MLLAGRIGQPSMAGADSANAKPMGEQAINTKSRLKQHTTDLKSHLPWLAFLMGDQRSSKPTMPLRRVIARILPLCRIANHG
jgi:hypothetical protein